MIGGLAEAKFLHRVSMPHPDRGGKNRASADELLLLMQE